MQVNIYMIHNARNVGMYILCIYIQYIYYVYMSCIM